MVKQFHEIRDPIHVFIRFDSGEREVVNSRPFQRLRHIHQLGLTYLVYPGASHRRFEHSLGVMELAGRVYDIVTAHANITHDLVRAVVPQQGSHHHSYWRLVVRMAALLHDVGHLPFSHVSEDLLPKGCDHEWLTREIILSDELESILKEIKIQPEDVAKVAVGPKNYKNVNFTDWEAILSEIIVGDAFGVDRMDYLLRDSHHAGVPYGRFDHYRLIDTLRILPKEEKESREPVLGVEGGGLHCAEALLWARYFMYTQLYYHPVRRIYDLHLRDFLRSWLTGGYFPTAIEDHLKITDNDVSAALLAAARDANCSGNESARRIISRDHYRCIYERNPDDIAKNPEASVAIFDSLCNHFGAENVRIDRYKQKGRGPDFPVLGQDRRISSSVAMSETLRKIPVVATDYIYVPLEKRDEVKKWIEQNRATIIEPRKEEE